PAVDGGDRGFVAGFDAAQHAMDHFGEFAVVGEGLPAVEVGDVAAGDECAIPRAGDDDHADGVVALEAGERGFELQQRGYVEGVERLRTIDGQDARPLPALDLNRVFGHGRVFS